MLGERLYLNLAVAGELPSWPPLTPVGPLGEAEVAARETLGERAWWHWVERGWYSVENY